MMKKSHKLAWCNWYTLSKMPQRTPNPHNWLVSKQGEYFPGYYFAQRDRKGRDIAKSWRAAESIDAKVHYQISRGRDYQNSDYGCKNDQVSNKVLGVFSLLAIPFRMHQTKTDTKNTITEGGLQLWWEIFELGRKPAIDQCWWCPKDIVPTWYIFLRQRHVAVHKKDGRYPDWIWETCIT